VDLQQVHGVGAQPPERLSDDLGRVSEFSLDRGLGRQENALAGAQVLEDSADDQLGVAVCARRVASWSIVRMG
jgi:hypothetical protein